ncbi:ribonuclease HI [Mycolicibacterium gilvum]|uniref:Ribonuclease H n=1 Tax=Mycolicibacterium gilvum TaxID=1804 RepID=A0A378SIU4_9MYCO|nr:RNase H family protein [Mycolicibacterium gilvum]MCV7056518.1 ribonuclease H [Mycolicibacterium gilvum]STZ41826.1 ribonuclease H [Mycolicibacterium gilvum]
MAPKPVAGTRPLDIVTARSRPMLSVALAVRPRSRSVFAYSANSAQQCWSGTVDAESADTATLDVIRRIHAAADAERIRFVVQLPARSTLWALRDEVALLMPGVWIERPRFSDEALVRGALSGLREVMAAAPVCVATDGSVRGKITGYGWLASTGEYGLQGFRHSTKLIGPQVVLVAELRAIGAAVQRLRGRDITVLSDSRPAIGMVKRWMDGEDVLPEGYLAYRESGKTPGLVRARQMIFEDRARITPLWVKGHRGEPLNEGADALARLASRYALGDSALDATEYHRRASDLAVTFSREFTRARSA